MFTSYRIRITKSVDGRSGIKVTWSQLILVKGPTDHLRIKIHARVLHEWTNLKNYANMSMSSLKQSVRSQQRSNWWMQCKTGAQFVKLFLWWSCQPTMISLLFAMEPGMMQITRRNNIQSCTMHDCKWCDIRTKELAISPTKRHLQGTPLP